MELARQVADELKRLIGASVNSIREGKHQDAFDHLNQALSITELIEYHAGSAMALYNLANLYVVTGENISALETAAIALEKAKISLQDVQSYQKLLLTLLLAVQKDGASCAKNRDYSRALACFEAALPHVAEEKKASLERQITLLRRVLNERQGNGRGVQENQRGGHEGGGNG